jgi:Flp pilus assembly protein TadD
MSEVIVCPSCGAKVRARHQRCPRCRAKFTEATSPGLDFSRVAPAALGVLTLVGVIAAYAMWRQAGEPRPEPVAAPAVAVPQPAARPARTEPALPETAAGPSMSFADPGRAGNAAYGAGNYGDALAAYRAAVEKNPNDAESWSNMGQVLVRLGRVEEALPCFDRAIQLNGDRWAYHFNLARAHGLLGRWDVAVNEYRQAQRLLPDDYAVTFNLGLALRKAGDTAGAVPELARAAELNPQDASFQLALARAYDELGRKQEAVAAYQQTLALAPDATEAPIIRSRIDALLK